MDRNNIFRLLILANIKRLRKARGISQDDMAVLLGMTKQNYYRIESGRQAMRVEHLPVVAEALNTNMEDLFSTEQIHQQLGHAEQLMLSYLRRMDRKRVNSVITLVREIQTRELSDDQVGILLSLLREFKQSPNV